MGLNMNSTARILLILALAISGSSCIQTPEEEKETPSTAEAVQNALSEGWGTANPLTMAPNDFLFQETEQKIDGNPNPFFVLQEGITITKKDETPTDVTYTYLYQNRVFKDGSVGKESTREDRRTVRKSSSNILIDPIAQTTSVKPMADDYQMTLGFERLYGLAFACVKTDGIDKYCKEQLGMDSCEIQCSNLKTTESLIPVPDLIKNQPSCGGFANCKYNIKKVDFDWTIHLKKGDSIEKQRVNYSISMSPDLPFFSRVTEYCFRQLYPVQNQKVLVTTCTKLKNFERGSPQ